jgi:hypothetical protein
VEASNKVSNFEETRVTLSLYELAQSPDNVSALTGLNPSRIWIKGTPIKHDGDTDVDKKRVPRVAKCNAWFLRIRASSDSTLDRQLGLLLDLLRSHREQFRQASQLGELQLEIYIEYDLNANPTAQVGGIIVDPELMTVLGDLGASISIDITLLRD